LAVSFSFSIHRHIPLRADLRPLSKFRRKASSSCRTPMGAYDGIDPEGNVFGIYAVGYE